MIVYVPHETVSFSVHVLAEKARDQVCGFEVRIAVLGLHDLQEFLMRLSGTEDLLRTGFSIRLSCHLEDDSRYGAGLVDDLGIGILSLQYLDAFLCFEYGSDGPSEGLISTGYGALDVNTQKGAETPQRIGEVPGSDEVRGLGTLSHRDVHQQVGGSDGHLLAHDGGHHGRTGVDSHGALRTDDLPPDRRIILIAAGEYPTGRSDRFAEGIGIHLHVTEGIDEVCRAAGTAHCA